MVEFRRRDHDPRLDDQVTERFPVGGVPLVVSVEVRADPPSTPDVRGAVVAHRVLSDHDSCTPVPAAKVTETRSSWW